jgi:serine/threonine protein kinase
MSHKHIVKFVDVFDERSKVYLVMERMTGGTLLKRILGMKYYYEAEPRRVSNMLMEGIAYCHEHNVAHRDLKLENFFLAPEGQDYSVKIGDFGMAKKCTSKDCLTTQCGSPHYIAPEILYGNPYGTQVDMWSLGVNIYILLCGEYPFYDGQISGKSTMGAIEEGNFKFDLESWDLVSKEAKNLITKLLDVDPNKRLTAKNALHASWFHVSDEDAKCVHLGLTHDRIKTFYAKKKFRAAVHTIMATRAFQEELAKSESNDNDNMRSLVVMLQDIEVIENSDFSINF